MIAVIKGNACLDHRRALDMMFEDRKRLFVDLLGWNVPVVAGRFEVDHFDDEHAIYLVEIDRAGGHAGSMRLIPSERPHILDSLFASLCKAGVPVSSSTVEITRLCLPARHGATERLAIRNRLISAMVDYALGAGIDALTGVVEMRFLTQVLAMGWRCEPLGAPQRIHGRLLGAFRISVDADTPARLVATGIYVSATIASASARARAAA